MHAETAGDGPAGGTARLEELVGALDALADQTAASMARELVQLVLELHGAALSSMFETIEADPAGERLIGTLLGDTGVEGVLLLHGLHPHELEARVRAALDRLHPYLGLQGVAVEGFDIADGRLSVRLGPSDAGPYRQGSAEAIRQQVEAAVFAVAPDLAALDIEGLPAHVAIIPVSSITVRRRATEATAS